MSDTEKPPDRSVGHPVALNPFAKSASRTEPAFIARPAGAPVYYGFQILSDVVVDDSHSEKFPISIRSMH